MPSTTPRSAPPLPAAVQARVDAEIAQLRAEAVAELRGRTPRAYTAADIDRLRGQSLMSLVHAALREANRHVSPDGSLNIRAWLSVGGLQEIDSIVEAAVLFGTEATTPTCDGFCRRGVLTTFLQTQIGRPATAARLSPVPKGGTADGVAIEVEAEAHQLARYGAAFEIDEQDFLTSQPLDAALLALEEAGRAAGRLLPDLVYAVLLENAALSDGTAAFHTDRGNLGTGVLSTGNLDVAMQALASQVLTDSDGAPVHRGLQAAFLIVPPALYGLALRLNRDMEAGLTVLAESRISATGVLDPRDGTTLRVGSATNWLLAASERQCPSIVVSGYGKSTAPKIRSSELTQGQWGRGYDLQLDLACSFGDPAGLYWSSGTV
jgi:hypothetical protein